jgi:hypothetical protein
MEIREREEGALQSAALTMDVLDPKNGIHATMAAVTKRTPSSSIIL